MTMNRLNSLLLLCAAVFMLSSCIQDNFDTPPVYIPPSIDASQVMNIGDLLTSNNLLGNCDLVSPTLLSGVTYEGKYIKGVVTSDDFAGNFYKSLVIQDATGAISLSLDATNLNAQFPVGREVYVKLDGLYAGVFACQPTLGGGLDGSDIERIAEPLIDQHILKGDVVGEPSPEVLALNGGLNPSMINKLFVIENCEFDPSFIGQTYANIPVSPTYGKDVIVNGCNGGNVIVRMSDYAAFAGDTLPIGNGSIVGILGIYNDEYQFTIRDTNDVDMKNPRCDGADNLILNKDFEDQEISSGGWTTQVLQGPHDWSTSNQGGGNSYYAVLSNWNGQGNDASEAWLISPSMNLSGVQSATLEFRNAYNYGGPTMQLYVSTDFDNQSSVGDASWTELSYTQSQGGFAFVTATVDLSNFISSNVHIAFRYTGSDQDGSTWEVDDIRVFE